jgi:hypothetical protein
LWRRKKRFAAKNCLAETTKKGRREELFSGDCGKKWPRSGRGSRDTRTRAKEFSGGVSRRDSPVASKQGDQMSF